MNTTLESIRHLFALHEETDYDGTLQEVRADVEFRSGNTWALVCAILIASVGLNVNSTAVIIGGMLISPLMGPIVGAGFGLATNDVELLRRGVRNLAVAVIVGLIASTVYFAVSPLEGPQSELLARTRPTLYDVLIAVFGGIAGVVAVTRRGNKSQVVPGVAIATALMPPLCTAGFGLANGDAGFFLGAMHLFSINALFIGLATAGLARLMRFPRGADLHPSSIIRTRNVIAFLTVTISVPSVYTGWRVVHEARFNQAAHRFVLDNFTFADRALVNVEMRYAARGSIISATVLGEPLSNEAVAALEQRLGAYGLDGTRLVLNQPDKGHASPEQISQMVRQEVLEDLYRRNEDAMKARDARIRVLEDEVVRLRTSQYPVREILSELAALYPGLVGLSIGQEARTDAGADSSQRVVAVALWRRVPGAADQERMRKFLMARLNIDPLRLVNISAE